MKRETNGWYAADVIARPEAAIAVEAALDSLDPLGTEIDSLRVKPGEPLRVTAYFEDSPELNRLEAVIKDHLEIFGFGSDEVLDASLRNVKDEDWLAEWKKHWRPTVVDRFVIAPPWSIVDGGDQILIRIEPNMAFGTGTHQTTQLCLTAIGQDLKRGESFLDVGTGTGILSIAAAKLGASPIYAFDTDVDSVSIARENATANEVSDKVDLAIGTLDVNSPEFDFVCANLTIDVILPMLDLLIAKSRRKLVLSGILQEQISLIQDAMTERDLIPVVAEKDEWVAVLVDIN